MNEQAKAYGRAITHILEGFDIPAPPSLLKVSAKSASEHLESLPYSLATNLAHAVLWQNFWLQKLGGGRQASGMTEWRKDFRVPEPGEFETLRKEFVSGLEQARAIAEAEPFQHGCADDAQALDTLARIVVHASYHMGQMMLLKRVLKGRPKS